MIRREFVRPTEHLKVTSVCTLLAFLLFGCSYRNLEDGLREKAGEVMQPEKETVVETPEDDREKHRVVIHTEGSDNPFSVDGIGSKVDFTIYGVHFYENAMDFPGISEARQSLADPRECGFLTMKVDVHNVNYAGDAADGTVHMGLIGISKKEVDENAAWPGGADGVWMSPHGDGDDYWHFPVKPGETKTCKMGFLIQDTDAAKLGDYVIASGGAASLGGCYEIPYE